LSIEVDERATLEIDLKLTCVFKALGLNPFDREEIGNKLTTLLGWLPLAIREAITIFFNA
jgi:hypothetical protein